MKRAGVFSLTLTLAVAAAAARAQDNPPAPPPQPQGQASPAPAPAPSATPAAPKPPEPAPAPKQDTKAPDPSKPVLGEPVAAGTVARKGLFPLDEGRTWRYELRTWLMPSSSEDGVQEEIEPPRSHHLDVRVVESDKIDGRDARCLEYKLDDEPAQRAYFFEDAGAVLCPRRVLGAGEHVHKYDFAPPQPTLSGDLAVNSTWEWKGKVGSVGGKQSFKVLGEAKVVTHSKEVGTVDAIVVQSIVENDDDSKGVTTKWFAPGWGIVRELTEVKAEKETFRTEAILSKATRPKD
jgi:hypothetical protein